MIPLDLWTRLFVTPPNWHLVVLAAIPTAVVAWLAGRAARRLVVRLMRAMLRDTVALSSPVVRTPLRLIGAAAFVLVFGVLIVPAFELLGLQPRTGVHLRALGAWTFNSGLRVLLIAAVAYASVRTVDLLVDRFEHDVNFGSGLDALERAKRARTLGGVLTSVTTIAVAVIAVLMILHEFNVDVTPALTGAGIAGVALGFGAQALVKDLIGGFFLILENQIRVGDVASINGIGGLVEAINLRTIVLRNEEGSVYIIPNGTITTLANLSKDYSYAVLNVPVAYSADLDGVTTLLHEIGGGLQNDPALGPSILAPMEISGVDGFEEFGLTIHLRIKTAPLQQWNVGRELRRRIKLAFEARGIPMWSPKRESITVRQAT
ncbi:MAG TPA: mechanosensitive ion channel family protein [Vicinamibacterales bacterium]|nr:mechanosensitive ion channel family protein [Vicinamibacterales bacterium]